VSLVPRLVVFDCDGTLVDSQNGIVASMTGAFESLGLATPERGRILSIVGLSLHEAMARLADPGDAAAIPELVRRYKAGFSALRADAGHAEPLYDGVPEAIERLAMRDEVLLGIATGKSQRGVARLLERHGLAGRFATIQTADDAPSKPHPAMLLQAMRATGARPEATVMIGDTTFDMEMARNARAHGVGVDWGYHPGAALRTAGAGSVLGHMAELDRVLDGLWPAAREMSA
jgi:phosphoglycolate phosphatase